MSEASGEIRFDTRAGYQQAIDTLMQSAARAICIFDPDLRDTGLESRAGSEAFGAFLAGGRDRSVRIVLHDTDHFTRYCPRLTDLLRRFSHSLHIRQTPDSLRALSDCFMLADENGAVIRFHADHFRGKLLQGLPDETQPWRRRFEDLWEESLPGPSPTLLGL